MDNNPASKPDPFEVLPRISLLQIVVLVLITVGIYVPYWLYTRSVIINRFLPDSPVPVPYMALCIVAMAVMFGFALNMPAVDTIEQLMATQEYAQFREVAGIVQLLLLFWGLLLCHKFNRLTGAVFGQALHANYFYLCLAHLLFGNIFYLQYKVNQILDSRKPGVM